MSRTPNPRTIELPPLSIRASVGTFDAEARTVDLIFSTGAGVERFDWNSGKRFIEKLAITPSAMRLDRLNSGAPLLDSHSAWSVTDQLGAVVAGSARVEKGKALATVRFSAREAVAPIIQDVRDGIITSVSVGYRVYKFVEDTSNDNALPIRTATDWEPYEVSMVSMPADTGAKVRRDQVETNPCVIVTRHQEPNMKPKVTPATPAAATVESVDSARSDEQSESLLEENPLAERADEGDETPASEPEETPAASAQRLERERVQGILYACRSAKMPSAMFDKLVADGITLVEAQKRIFVEMTKRADPNPNAGPNAASRRSGIEMGDDPFLHVRSAIESAILHRLAPQHFKLDDKAREYRGMTMLDIAKVYLTARGVRVTGMDKMTIAGTALGLVQHRGGVGMHTTSDFPLLLADVANKTLRAEYEAAPQTFLPITRTVSLSDFKPSNRVQIGDAPSLKPVNEHGEFTRGTIAEGKEAIQLATYGRVFAITRKALVNDDTDAFSRVPQKFGRAARNLESDLVWYQILKNANMGDGTALFHANHANLAGAGLIGIGTIGAGETAMMLQTGLDGTTLVMATPRYLIVPPSQRVRALQFVSVNMQAQTAANVNPYAGKLEVITEPRLEVGITIGDLPNQVTATGSATAWYLAADPSQVDILEIAYLDGQAGPVVESRVGFDIDGLEIKCRHDVGAKVIDWRGVYKNDGSVDS